MSSDEFKRLRQRAGWTQADMALALGCSTGHVQRMETGKRQVQAHHARLAVLLAGARPSK